MDKLLERITEAIQLYLEVEESETEGLDFVGIQQVTVQQ